MNGTWIIPKRRLRSFALATLMITLGCATLNSPRFWTGIYSATHPTARVALEPSRFCVGETLTATWSDGVQIQNCDLASPDIFGCKLSSLRTYPYSEGLRLAGVFQAGNLSGSVSGPAEFETEYTSTFTVEWDGWSYMRSYRQRTDDGRVWTGIVQAQDTSSPMLARDYRLNSGYGEVCDEETGTWQFVASSTYWEEALPDGTFRGPRTLGRLSACTAITEICAPSGVGRVRVSVEGGPTVVLGRAGGPLCTDQFTGYHPDDIQIEPLDFDLPHAIGSACTPGELPVWLSTPFVDYTLAGSTLCAERFVGENFGPASSVGADEFEYGGIQLVGVSRDRCRAALDPDFLASYDETFGDLPPGSGGGGKGEPVSTEEPTEPASSQPSDAPTPVVTDEPTPVVTEAATEPPKMCEAGWVPVDACVCCNGNKVCPDHVEGNHPDCSDEGSSSGGGGNNPVCGDGVCEDSERGCGVCSDDCGPC